MDKWRSRTAQVTSKPDVYHDSNAFVWKWTVRVDEPGPIVPDGMSKDDLPYMYDVVAFDAEQAREAAMRRHFVNLDDYGTKYADVITMIEKREMLEATLAQIAHMCTYPMNATRRDSVRDKALKVLKETN